MLLVLVDYVEVEGVVAEFALDHYAGGEFVGHVEFEVAVDVAVVCALDCLGEAVEKGDLAFGVLD